MANRLQRLKKMGFQGRQTPMTAEDRSRMETRRQVRFENQNNRCRLIYNRSYKACYNNSAF